MSLLLDDASMARVLKESRTVAVIGAHPNPIRPSHFVPQYLLEHGYDVYPVNSRKAGEALWGKTIVPDLRQLEVPMDVVDVFRRADALDGHLEEILGMSPRPKVVWLQKGIRNDLFAAALSAEGIDVVQDRCMLKEHERLVMGVEASRVG